MDGILVINDQCGALKAAPDGLSADALVREFKRHGANVTVRLVPPDGFERELRTAAKDGAAAVYVGGGDGSVSTAARCVAGTDRVLGVLPLGTLNHFAKDLGFSVSWKTAVAELAQATPRRVDLGEVNGRIFINNCSLGAYPAAVRQREALRRDGLGKWVAMTRAILTEFWRLRRIRFELELPTGTTRLRTPFVIIANNRYSGHVLSQQLRPELDAGRLWLYTTRAEGRFQLLRLAWQSFARRIDAADALEKHPLTQATIRTPAAGLPVGMDGEVVDLTSPLELRIRPQALSVLTPAPTPERASALRAMAVAPNA